MGILLPPVSQVTNSRINLTQHHRNRSLDSALQQIPEVRLTIIVATVAAIVSRMAHIRLSVFGVPKVNTNTLQHTFGARAFSGTYPNITATVSRVAFVTRARAFSLQSVSPCTYIPYTTLTCTGVECVCARVCEVTTTTATRLLLCDCAHTVSFLYYGPNHTHKHTSVTFHNHRFSAHAG